MRVGVESGYDVFDANTAAIVEEEDVDAHEPAAKRPDGVAAGGFGERFEDGAKAEEGAVNQDRRLRSCEPLLVAVGEGRCGVVLRELGMMDGVGESVWWGRQGGRGYRRC